MTIGSIAESQKIPRRYLEGILNQLQKGGLLEAERGRHGGYRLARDVGEITVGEVVRLIDGRIRAVECVEQNVATDCPMRSDCVFLPTWRNVQRAIDQALDSTTFLQMVKLESASRHKQCLNYTI